MKQPVLTISIAAYNVAQYLPQTLESCLIPSLEKIEVLVLNDGSHDDTEEHCRYLCRAPSPEHPRHHQSQRGIRIDSELFDRRRTRHILKLLDGDDWVDTDGLEALVLRLEGFTGDLDVAPYARRAQGAAPVVVDQASDAPEGIGPFDACAIAWRLSMHSMTIRTSLLRQCGVRLDEHSLYTDTDYVTVPLPLIQTVQVSHRPVYQYRVDREGQSMTSRGRLRHRSDMEALIGRLTRRFSAFDRPESRAYGILRAWLLDDAVAHYQLLFSMRPSSQRWHEIANYRSILRQHPVAYDEILRFSDWARLFDSTTLVTYPVAWAAFNAYQRIRRRVRR